MEPPIATSICLICFESIEKLAFVPSDVHAKIFRKCSKYLHSSLTKDTLKDIQLNNENQLPLCKSCFDSAWQLTQLSEQLTIIEKEISDLTVAFSMSVFHRRSQIYSQSCNNSQKIEFNEVCLPPNLFSTKTGDQYIRQNKTCHDVIISSFDTKTEILDVKSEINDHQVDNLSGNSQVSIANDDVEIQIDKMNLDEHCKQPTPEQNRNHEPASEIRIVHLADADGNDSKNCAAPKKGIRLKLSNLLKSVRMPEIKLKRINIESHEVNAQKVLDELLFMDDEISDPSHTPNSSRNGKLLYNKRSFCKKKIASQSNRKIRQRTHIGKQPFVKCSYCEKWLCNLAKLQIHERIHTGEKPFECSFCEQKFSQSSTRVRHERIHTGEKPYQCSFCEKKFSDSSNWKNHEKIHIMDKPFKCSFCEKSFAVKKYLKVHEMRHTGEKPYKFLYCEKTFRKISTKKSHQMTHRKKRASLINPLGNLKDGSIVHLRQQHEEMHSTAIMNFKCSFCPMTFSQDETRNIHEKVHRREEKVRMRISS